MVFSVGKQTKAKHLKNKINKNPFLGSKLKSTLSTNRIELCASWFYPPFRPPISNIAAEACFFKHIIITKKYGFSQRECIPLESETIRVLVG